MTILVTGATGRLGSRVVALLSAEDRRVRALVRPGRPRAGLEARGIAVVEGDLSDEKSLRLACRDVRGLVHCAARMDTWSRHDHEQRHVNVEGTARLYRAAHDHALERIVHVSSIEAIGATRDGRILDEAAPWNLRAIGIHYVATKRESEERAFAAAWGGMPVVVVNPGTLFGPPSDGRPGPAIVERIRRGEMRWVPAGGTSVCDVEDVARAIVAALDHGRVGERTILGGHNLAWIDLCAAIARHAGVSAPRRRVPTSAARALALGAGALDKLGLARPPWTPEVFRSWGWCFFVDSSKAVRELGYRIRPLDEILARSGCGSR